MGSEYPSFRWLKDRRKRIELVWTNRVFVHSSTNLTQRFSRCPPDSLIMRSALLRESFLRDSTVQNSTDTSTRIHFLNIFRWLKFFQMESRRTTLARILLRSHTKSKPTLVAYQRVIRNASDSIDRDNLLSSILTKREYVLRWRQGRKLEMYPVSPADYNQQAASTISHCYYLERSEGFSHFHNNIIIISNKQDLIARLTRSLQGHLLKQRPATPSRKPLIQ